MAKFLFTFFEGSHDANFFARILVESGQYKLLKAKVAAYPKDISKFLQGLYESSNPDDVVVGIPPERITPVLALKSTASDSYILGFITGGCTKTDGAAEVIKRISSFAIPESPEQAKLFGNVKHSILFVFDADNRGIAATRDSFRDVYKTILKDFGDISNVEHNSWTNYNSVKIGLYVFCDGGGTGTLEDNVFKTLTNNQGNALTAANGYLDTHSSYLTTAILNATVGDKVTLRAKMQKAIFTIAGQREKKLAGSSLAVILRDTEMLDGAFDFGNEQEIAYKIKILVEQAFH